MDNEKEVLKNTPFDEEAPAAPEFTLDEDNPLKWGDEVEQKLPEFDMSDWGEPVKETVPEEPVNGFETEPPVNEVPFQDSNQQTGWNQGHGFEQPQYNQAYGQQQDPRNGQQAYQQQYGPQGQYGQPYGQQPYGQPYQPYQQGPVGEKNKLVAGLLALLLGTLGIHKFYLGLNQQGIIMIVCTLAGSLLCGLGPIVMGIISIIEGIMYLTQTDQGFYEIYEVGKKPWF